MEGIGTMAGGGTERSVRIASVRDELSDMRAEAVSVDALLCSIAEAEGHGVSPSDGWEFVLSEAMERIAARAEAADAILEGLAEQA